MDVLRDDFKSFFRRATLILPLLSIIAACGNTPTTSSTAGGDWVKHVDPSGYTVSQPSDWTSSRDSKTGMVTLRGTDGAQVTVLPFYTSQTLDSHNASAALQQLGSNLLPQAQWQTPLPPSGSSDRMTGKVSGNPAMAVVAWTQTSSNGTAGYAYAYSASTANYASDINTAAKVMASFMVRGAGTTATPAPTYTTWTDPNEAAFSLEIPQNWTATGGLTRPSSLLTRDHVIGTSADQSAKFLISNNFPGIHRTQCILGRGQQLSFGGRLALQ